MPSQKFHGLEKIHLNNSVEDATYLNEYIGSILFRRCGCSCASGGPCPGHAEQQSRSACMCSKKVSRRTFSRLYFKDTHGNLYDTVKPAAGHSSAHDVDQPLARDSGEGPEDRSDLKALAAAANEIDLTRRWKLLEQALDVDRFITFMAMEVMVGHRDGYCLARNNFRVYHDLDSSKIIFFPHGMDQLFGKPDNPYKPFMSGLVAKAVMETPEGERWYKLRFGILFSNVFDVPAIHREIDRKLAQLRPALPSREFRALQNDATILKTRIASRHAHLLQQLLTPELQPVTFTEGIAVLKDWRPVDEPPGGKMDKTPAPDGKAALHIRAGPVTGASWRSRVILKRGGYRFEGLIQTASVEPLSFGKLQGAALRVVGRPRSEGESVVGTSGWEKSSTSLK